MKRWHAARVTALCGAALLGACSGPGRDGQSGGTREAVPVTVAAVRQQDVPMQLRTIGSVEAYSTVSIKSQVEGQLAEVHFREGEPVARGDLLFTIDPRPFEAALRQAEANQAKNQAEASNAIIDANRRAKLLADGFISTDENDQAQTRAASLQAAVKADQAAVENAKLQLQYCYIHSPIDGRIGRLLVHEGNVVKTNDTILAVINQIRPIYVTFSLPEQQLVEIRERAASGKLEVQAFVGQAATEPVRGELSFINNTVDTTTGTVLLKGLFTNEREQLWPGQFVDVALTLSVTRDALLVPAEAVQTGQQGPYVFVIGADAAAELRPVVVGRSAGHDVIVTTGLQAGERVVTDGQIRLAPGAKVEIKDGAHAPATPAPSPGGA
ncbi:MAG TPA: efflux RND transporter periplasmic adaptor subunit [Candidatus Kryptonia bacterium]|nr:efflux RND transporter periplasmic adaptor subunit [Candidatus Kryptonia bacterium]